MDGLQFMRVFRQMVDDAWCHDINGDGRKLLTGSNPLQWPHAPATPGRRPGVTITL